MIYFIQQENNNGLIKIGFTNNIKGRIYQLQKEYLMKMHLRLLIKGDKNKENKLQYQFKKYHSKGEWFKPSKEMLNFIRKNKDKDIRDEKASSKVQVTYIIDHLTYRTIKYLAIDTGRNMSSLIEEAISDLNKKIRSSI